MQKLYHSITDISLLIDEETHILRYWEKEFDILKPRKNRSGNRIYSNKDLSIVKTIKKFLREEKLSLKGAKEKIATIDFSQEDELAEQLFVDPNEINQKDSILDENKFEEKLSPNEVKFSRQDLSLIKTALNEALTILKY